MFELIILIVLCWFIVLGFVLALVSANPDYDDWE